MQIPVYLEVGDKRTMACALEWPGWSRGGGSEEAALSALCNYAQRYASAVEGAQAGFVIPTGVDDFKIIERLKGDSSTDYGVPNKIPQWDLRALATAELERLESLMNAIWQAFDRTVLAAQGNELRKGPRGGGRELEQIVQHVLESETGYLANLGVKHNLEAGKDPQEAVHRLRKASLEGLHRSVRGELPEYGPRGGKRWKPRQYVRRVAWHALDHAWEIEDRST